MTFLKISGEVEDLFRDVRDALEDVNASEEDYRGFEVWEGSQTFALLEDDAYIVYGNEDRVVDVLRLLERGTGSMADAEDNALYDIWNKLPSSGIIVVSSSCPIRRCEGYGFGITETDESLEEGKGTATLLFSSEQAAGNAADEYEEIANFLETTLTFNTSTYVLATSGDGLFVLSDFTFE